MVLWLAMLRLRLPRHGPLTRPATWPTLSPHRGRGAGGEGAAET